jgi:hypothetical protein
VTTETQKVPAAGSRPESRSDPLPAVWSGGGVWSTLALAIAGVFLVSLYQRASERSFDAQLEIHIKALVSEMLETSDETVLRATPQVQQPTYLGDPRFSLPLSGWYWTVRQADTGTVLYASESLVGDPLAVPALGEAEVLEPVLLPDRPAMKSGFCNSVSPLGRRRLRHRCWGCDCGLLGRYPRVRAPRRTDASHRRAWTGFGHVSPGPCRANAAVRLRSSLSAVRQGEAERIDEALPREIAPLAVELNSLIGSNKEIVERARTHVGNLAHGLKTPLSVISNEARASEGPLAEKVIEQTEVMSTQIQHHLERARMAAQRRVIGVSCEVQPVLDRLVRAMNKIYRERDVRLDGLQDAKLRFRGEGQDLEEMSGNLIDNACKWAKYAVQVTATPIADASSARGMVEIRVEDDGPGLSEEQCAEAVKRGRRLDETVPVLGSASRLLQIWQRFTEVAWNSGGLQWVD